MDRSEELLFQKHAKTFSLAARCFKKDDREKITSLYAFCRTIDDRVDLAGNIQEAKEFLDRIEQELSDQRLSLFPSMERVMQEILIHPFYLRKMVKSIRQDLHSYTLKTVDELYDYCMGVAATVGVIVCHIVGPVKKGALKHAIDLGIAMQITNIVRDVKEDAERGKIYLPEALFQEDYLTGDLERDLRRVSSEFAGNEVFLVRQKMVTLAARHYQSARAGLLYLPFRARMAVFAAATLYEAIGDKALKKRADERACLSTLEKSRLLISKTPSLFCSRREVKAAHPPLFYKEMEEHYAGL